MTLKRKKLTSLEISGVDIPAGSDMDVSCSVAPIAGAADMRRTVNADLINIARAVFKKYGLDLSGSDTHLPGVEGLMPGDYVEVIPHDRITVTVSPASSSVSLMRAGVDVVGVTPDGRRIQPTSQPPDPRPLSASRSAARIQSLRTPQTLTFAESVSAVRFRPCFSCKVMSWSTSADERMRTSSWNLRVEED